MPPIADPPNNFGRPSDAEIGAKACERAIDEEERSSATIRSASRTREADVAVAIERFGITNMISTDGFIRQV